jgi:hypothetical protein
MTELRDQKIAMPKTADLNDAELLGFEWVETEFGEEVPTEQALGVALNKRGEGIQPPSP